MVIFRSYVNVYQRVYGDHDVITWENNTHKNGERLGLSTLFFFTRAMISVLSGEVMGYFMGYSKITGIQ
jgi:hypothetical protein